MPGLFDDILQPPAAEAQGAPSAGLFADILAAQPQEKPGMMADVGKSAGGGLVSGIVGMASMPADMGRLAMVGGMKGAAYLKRLAGFEDSAKATEAELANATGAMDALGKVNVGGVPVLLGLRTSEQNKDAVSSVAPSYLDPNYRPETGVGRYTKTIAELAPAAVAGPGGAVRNTFGAILGGGLSETAGHALEGSPWEGPARAAGAIVGMGAPAIRLTPSRAVAQAMDGVSQADIAAAQSVMENAAKQGVALTWDEAISQAKGQMGGLSNLRRVVEQGEGGAPIREVMAARPGQVETAARSAMADVAPVNQAPSRIGPDVGKAADSALGDVNKAINKATDGLYKQAEKGVVPAQELQGNATYAAGLKAVRNDPIIGPTLAGEPDNSVKVVDAVKKWADKEGENLASFANPNRDRYKASVIGADKGLMVEAADRATGSNFQGVQGAYEEARATQAALRDKFLQPLLDGPLGKLAGEKTTQQAIEALFPANPLPASEKEIQTAVQALVKRNPNAARDLVRAHAESVFNEAAQNNIPGANAFGGAKFAAQIVGNPQQAKNLETAVRALPNGDATWSGFRNMLDALEATGKAPRMGSNTAPDLGARKLMTEAVGPETVANPMRAVRDFAEKVRLGRNMSQVASILTDPRSAGLLRELAKAPRGGSKALAIAGRIVLRSEAAQTRGKPVNQVE